MEKDEREARDSHHLGYQDGDLGDTLVKTRRLLVVVNQEQGFSEVGLQDPNQTDWVQQRHNGTVEERHGDVQKHVYSVALKIEFTSFV